MPGQSKTVASQEPVAAPVDVANVPRDEQDLVGNSAIASQVPPDEGYSDTVPELATEPGTVPTIPAAMRPRRALAAIPSGRPTVRRRLPRATRATR